MDLSRVTWRKSRRSGGNGGDCVEVGVARRGETLYLMRDSKDPDGPVLAFTPAEMGAFIGGVKDGEFDDLG